MHLRCQLPILPILIMYKAVELYWRAVGGIVMFVLVIHMRRGNNLIEYRVQTERYPNWI